MTQLGDAQLGCAEIEAQFEANRAEAADLLVKANRVSQDNAVKAVASVVVSGWIAFTIDMSHAEQIKMRSIVDRNEHLLHLASKKGCKIQ